ncbi:MAG: NTP transferase domain-containing protein, partial [Alphaproteobacteria bacterium]|nr:NTP transferase domain-containing protein [Alphaproteobacteria bacterium]
PLTAETPKPLLPVAGRPMIEHVIEHLAGEGIQRFIVTTNYLADKFPETLGDGSHLNVEISYIREGEPFGTLGSLGLIDHSEMSAPLLVTNGDVMSRLDFGAFLQNHEASGADLSVCVKEYSHLVPYGVVNVEDDVIIGLEEKPEKNFLINAGIYCINPGVLHLIPKNRALDFPEFMKTLVENGHSVASYRFNGYWRDVGTIEDYSRANIELREFLTASD